MPGRQCLVRTLVVFCFVFSWIVGLMIVYVAMPNALMVSVSEAFSAAGVARVLLWALPALVIGLTATSLVVRLRRLPRPATSRFDGPFSWWRTIKASFVVAGWAQIGTIYLWVSVGSALGKVADPTLNGPGVWIIAVFGIGIVILFAGYLMAVVDIFAAG